MDDYTDDDSFVPSPALAARPAVPVPGAKVPGFTDQKPAAKDTTKPLDIAALSQTGENKLGAEAAMRTPVRAKGSARALLYDPKGRPLTVTDPVAAQQAYLSGHALPVAGQQVPMVHPETGAVVTVDARDVDQAVKAGATFATQDQYRKTELEAKWEKTGTEAIGNIWSAANQGFARGASLGLSDAAQVEIAKVLLPEGDAAKYREYLRDMKELHDLTSTAGEIGGMIAGAKAAGGGGAGRLLPSALMETGAAGLEGQMLRGGAQALGTGLGQVPTRMGAGVARGLIEGAGGGVSRTISEAALGDENVNAEKLVANVTHDALLYGAVGGAFGGVAGLFGAGLKAAAPTLRREGALQAVRALNPHAAELRVLSKSGREEVEQLGHFVTDKLGMARGESIEQIIPRLEQYEETWAKNADQLLGKIGSNRASYIETGALVRRLRGEVLQPLLESPIMAPHAKEVEGIIGRIEAAKTVAVGKELVYEPMAFAEARSLRMQLDDVLQRSYESVAIPTVGKREAQVLRGVFEDEIEKAVGRVGVATKDADLLAQYATMKHDYKMLRTADKILGKAEAREYVKGMGFVMPSYMYGIGGAITGAALGGPVGALKGAALGVGQKWAKDRGASTLAVTFKQLADIGEMKAIIGSVDKQIKTDVGSYFRGLPLKLRAYDTPKQQRENINKRFDREYTNVQQLATDPEELNKRLQRLEPMSQNAPKHHAATVQVIGRGLQFLASKVPTKPDPHNALQPALNNTRLSDAEMDKFLRYVDTVKNPMIALRDLRNGSITPEHVEALRTVYPGIYANIQRAITEYIGQETHEGREVPYQKQMQLATLFGVAVNSTQDPRFVQLLQATHGPMQPDNKPKPPGRPSAIDGVGNMFQTEYEKREQKGYMR